MNTVFESIFLFALALLGINVTIYVLSVTLLPKAFKIFRNVRSSFSTEKEMQDEQVRLSDMNKLSHHVENINTLSFTYSVTFPCLCFLIAIVSSVWGRYIAEAHEKFDWSWFWIAIVATLAGIFFIVKTLKTIEEVLVTLANERDKNKSS